MTAEQEWERLSLQIHGCCPEREALKRGFHMEITVLDVGVGGMQYSQGW